MKRIFAPFFAGAAGTGEIWFWRESLQKPDLRRHLARFAWAVEGIDPRTQHFEPIALGHPRLRIYLLKGETTLLAWCRDKQNDWRTKLDEGKAPEQLDGLKVNLSPALQSNNSNESTPPSERLMDEFVPSQEGQSLLHAKKREEQ